MSDEYTLQETVREAVRDVVAAELADLGLGEGAAAASPLVERTVELVITDPTQDSVVALFSPVSGEKILAIAFMPHALPEGWLSDAASLIFGDDTDLPTSYGKFGYTAPNLISDMDVPYAPGGMPTYATFVGTEHVTASYYAGSVNEKQQLTLVYLSMGGSFKLSFDGEETSPIPVTGEILDLLAALEALSTIGVGNILVRDNFGGTTGPLLANGDTINVVVEFVGALAATAGLPLLEIDLTALTGNFASDSLVVAVAGCAPPSSGTLDMTIKFLTWRQSWD